MTTKTAGDLRATLADRIRRRQRYTGHENDRADQLRALQDGQPVVVSSGQLKSALWEAGLVTADELAAMYGTAPRGYVVHPDSTFETA
jgi:Trk K+ transport system NAD-binding subunit